jgi:hypothetical protein
VIARGRGRGMLGISSARYLSANVNQIEASRFKANIGRDDDDDDDDDNDNDNDIDNDDDDDDDDDDVDVDDNDNDDNDD